MTNPYQAIFFDLDGTLLDLIACERETLRRLLAETAPALGPAETERFLANYAAISPGHWAKGLAAGSTREEIVGGVFSAVRAPGGPDAPNLSGAAPLYWRIFASLAVLEPGAVEIVEKLSAHYRLGVISNGYADTQRPRLAAAGLTDFFEAIVVSGEVGWAKPDPRIFAHALEQLGVPPSAALYIGDSTSHDLTGALDAGMDFCLYRPSGSDGLQLPPGARLVTAFSQLAALLT